MRRFFFEGLTVVLVGAGLAFLWQATSFVGHRDYVGAVLAAVLGLAVLRVGGDLARLALAEKE